MNTNKWGFARKASGMGAAALAALLAAPTPAYAAGADILLPKPAEFIPALIAFLIIWAVLAKMAWPMIIGILDERQAKIEGDLKAAEDAKVQAQANVREYEGRIADADREAADIVAAARREAEEERAAILAKAQKDAAATIAKAHDAVDSERRKAMIELSGSVVDLAVEIAGKIIGNDLSDAEHRALAEKYLAEVGSSDAN